MLILNPDIKKQMNDEAFRCYPDECCGFFYGTENEAGRIVSDISTVSNTDEGNRKVRFSISPKEYMLAERKAEELNLQLLGVFHSHPDHPAIASETDRQSAMPFFSYIIISVSMNAIMDIRSWRLNEDRKFEEEEIHHIVYP
jgi:proteasome lid subunit RPN8/RPN11